MHTSIAVLILFAHFRDSLQQIGSGVGLFGEEGSSCRPAWSGWEDWSPCPVEPDHNAQSYRKRYCMYSPNGCTLTAEADCLGQQVEQKECQVPCRAEGQWSQWTAWTGHCPKTIGEQKFDLRARTCNPFPAGCQSDGTEANCKREAVQYKLCTPSTPPPRQCESKGIWSLWSAWTSCPTGDVTPLKYTQERRRVCQSVPEGCVEVIRPSCGAGNVEKRFCPCTSKGSWTLWSEWGSCLKVHGNYYTRHRSRTCVASPATCIPNPKVTPTCE